MTVEVVSDESWTKLLEAEPKYNDVKQTLQERIERLNNGLKKKESQYAEKQKSKVLSSLESRIIIEHFSGEYKEFPREVKQKLYEVISNSLNNGSLDLKNVKTGKALCEKMFRAIAGSGQDTCLIEFNSEKANLEEVADNSEYIKNRAKTIEKLFGLKYVDLKQEGETFDPEKLVKDSKESIERFDTAVNFLYELF